MTTMMNEKAIDRNTYKKFVNSTIDIIKCLLEFKGIPYKDGEEFEHFNKELPPQFFHYTKQIIFPWCDGDVVVGSLHCADFDMLSGKLVSAYPSIETYEFPWDHGDITVLDDPMEFVSRVDDYYHVNRKEND
jgi:hypothetical protein